MKNSYIFGLIGLAIGGALGYYFGYIRRKKEMEEELGKILENERNWYKKRCKELDEKYQKNLEENGIHIMNEEELKNIHKNPPDEKLEKKEPKAYERGKRAEALGLKEKEQIIYEHDMNEIEAEMREAYEHPEDDEPDDADVEEYLSRQRDYVAGGWKKPYIISEEEYNEEHEHDFDKINVYFYGVCGTYAEEGSGMPVEDPIGVFGEEACQAVLELFEDGRTDPLKHDICEIFVRNEGLAIDYCIEPKDTSYRAAVLGMEE